MKETRVTIEWAIGVAVQLHYLRIWNANIGYKLPVHFILSSLLYYIYSNEQGNWFWVMCLI